MKANRLSSDSTFGEVALDWFGHIETGFRSQKHGEQWLRSMEMYATLLWEMRVSDVNTEAVLAVLRPIWPRIPTTADRLRGRIEQVLNAAQVQGLRAGENPARWKGHLSLILPTKSKRSRDHLAAMPYDQVPAFMAALRQREGVSARILEVVVLLATGSAETFGARCSEIDWDEEVWTIPGARARTGKDHRVPLVGRALEIMREACQGKEPNAYVFPGGRPGQSLSAVAMHACLKRMNVDFTVHGFRSSFRDWAIDETYFADEIVDQALALVHLSYGRPHRRRYGGRDTLERRRELMKAWDTYCTKSAGMHQVRDELIALSQESDPHKRGKQLEHTLNGLFAACGVLIAEDFRRTGEQGGVVEQVDGVIQVDHELFLVEMKWWAEKISYSELAPHLSRLILRSGVSGIFISSSGYTPSAIEAAMGFLNQRLLVLCTVEEIVSLLDRGDDLIEFLRKKIRFARLDRAPFKRIL